MFGTSGAPTNQHVQHISTNIHTVHALLCLFVVWYELYFTCTFQDCFTGTGASIRLPSYHWSNSAYHHYSDVIVGSMASQIRGITIVYSTVYSGADQRKHQSSASPAFVQGIHRWPVNSPHKGPVTRKMFSSEDFIIVTVIFYHDTDMNRPWIPIKTQQNKVQQYSVHISCDILCVKMPQAIITSG